MEDERGMILIGLMLKLEQLGPSGPVIVNTCKNPVYIIGIDEFIVS